MKVFLTAVALPLAFLILPLAAQIPGRPVAEPASCVNHIPEAWKGAARAAALADCAFHDESVTTGAAAWAKYAADEVVTAAARGRDELRAGMAGAYAQPGFHLDWYPTSAEQHGALVITSGRFERTAVDATGTKRRQQGTYVTVWKLQKDGSYRFVWDGGEPDPDPAAK